MADAQVRIGIVAATTHPGQVLAAIARHAQARAADPARIRTDHQRWDDEGGSQPRS